MLLVSTCCVSFRWARQSVQRLKSSAHTGHQYLKYSVSMGARSQDVLSIGGAPCSWEWQSLWDQRRCVLIFVRSENRGIAAWIYKGVDWESVIAPSWSATCRPHWKVHPLPSGA
jgi:hypothetical protein